MVEFVFFTLVRRKTELGGAVVTSDTNSNSLWPSLWDPFSFFSKPRPNWSKPNPIGCTIAFKLSALKAQIRAIAVQLD